MKAEKKKQAAGEKGDQGGGARESRKYIADSILEPPQPRDIRVCSRSYAHLLPLSPDARPPRAPNSRSHWPSPAAAGASASMAALPLLCGRRRPRRRKRGRIAPSPPAPRSSAYSCLRAPLRRQPRGYLLHHDKTRKPRPRLRQHHHRLEQDTLPRRRRRRRCPATLLRSRPLLTVGR